jgi:predicted regulator of Ras-like GTPase activity (Roadblock/LC7/MglB family)
MKAVLREVMQRIPGSLGVAVIGLDGIPVETLAADDSFNIDLASAEGMSVVKRAAMSFRDTPPEPLEEVTISCRSRTTILRSVGSDYYLCVVIGPGSVPGQARFEAWRAGQHLREVIG